MADSAKGKETKEKQRGREHDNEFYDNEQDVDDMEI